MDISHLSDKLIEYAKPAALLIKDVAVWGGHYVKSGFTDRLVPTITHLWASSAQIAQAAAECMYADTATPIIVAGTLFIISFTAFKMSESHIYQENLCAKAAWKSIGLAALVASTAVTTFSIILLTA